MPSLGTREVFAFGPGVAIPTRLKFKELSPQLRPRSEVGGNMRMDSGPDIDRDVIGMVVERWRSATMSRKGMIEDELREFAPAAREEFAAPQSASALDPSRFKILKKPLESP